MESYSSFRPELCIRRTLESLNRWSSNCNKDKEGPEGVKVLEIPSGSYCSWNYPEDLRAYLTSVASAMGARDLGGGWGREPFILE